MEPKFEVGDWVQDKDTKRIINILSIGKNSYTYDVYILSSGEKRLIKRTWDFEDFDSKCSFFGKIRNNPISKELYKNRIYKETEKFLHIKPDFAWFINSVC